MKTISISIAASILFVSTALAQSNSVAHSVKATSHAVQATGHSVAAGSQGVVSGSRAAGSVVRTTGEVVNQIGEDLDQSFGKPLPISDDVVTAGPPPSLD